VSRGQAAGGGNSTARPDPHASPEVTVVMPTRNRLPFLSRSLPMALAQEDVDLEVVVVDDGSTDGTAEFLDRYEHPGLRVLRPASGHGVSQARNLAIEAAQGEWLAFLDDDDLWAPRKLRRQLDTARAEGASFVYCASLVIAEDGTVLRSRPAPPPAAVERELLLRNGVPGGGSNLIARTDLVRRVGGFDERLVHIQDWDLWIRLFDAGWPAACPDLCVAYLEHSGNVRFKADDRGVEEYEYMLAKYPALRRRLGDVDRRASYRYFARGHLRAGRRLRAARIYGALAVKQRSATDLLFAFGAAMLGDTARLMKDRVRPFRPPFEPTGELPWLRELLATRS
jgi:glycosyltransferase involved in cell wall biosynthesis